MYGTHLYVAVIVLLATADVPAVGEHRSPRVVTTKYGKLRGIIRSLPNKALKPVEVLLGVPYAAPPVGPKRFSPTKTPTPWTGERVADQYGPVCPQHLPELWGEEAEATMPRHRLLHLRQLANYLTHQAEDCLYLNVYVPSLVTDTSGHRALPVLVYIHGESFMWGAANPYDGSVLAALGEIIVVTLNYRLGPLGFLNTNADPSGQRHVANHGLLDQIAALHWIQENIGAFGGDPGSVTLMGHGTGAASIHFLMTSKAVAPGLFQRAILMSGSALSSWATVATPLQYALQFGHALNCTGNLPSWYSLHDQHQSLSTEDLDEMVMCLKDKPLEEIQAVSITAPQFLYAFGPSVDGIVIKNSFREKLRKTADALTKEYDLLFGVVPNESYDDFTQDDLENGISVKRRDQIFRTMIRNTFDYHLNEVYISVVNEYTDWQKPKKNPMKTRDATMDALSDARYVAPIIGTADNLRIGDKNQYFYVFNYSASSFQQPRIVKGPVHGEELPFALGAPLVGELGVFNANWSRQDQLLSEAILTYITNFVRTGNPNFRAGQGLKIFPREKHRFKNIPWEKYDPIYQKYLKIGIHPKAKSHYRAHPMALWTWLIPELQQVGRHEFLSLLDDLDENDVPVDQEKLQELSVVHHLFPHHNSPELYSGAVRPLHHMAGHYIVPSSTTTSVPPSDTVPTHLTHLFTTEHSLQHHLYKIQSHRPVPPKATARAEPTMNEDAGHVSYSTALSVTIAIGVSFLLLNALIFTGIFYQRDRHGMGNKQEQQSHHSSQSSSEQQLGGTSSMSGPFMRSASHSDISKPSYTSSSPCMQVPLSHLPYSHTFTHISECPSAFTDKPPCKDSSSGLALHPSFTPNGSATLLAGDDDPQHLYELQETMEGHHQHHSEDEHFTVIPAPPVTQMIPSESQPLLPLNIPSPPRGKVPTYGELRV